MLMIPFETKKVLAEISSNGATAKRLTLTSWNGAPEKLDLRIWRTDEAEVKPSKGMTLADDEARTLLDALQAYFADRV